MLEGREGERTKRSLSPPESRNQNASSRIMALATSSATRLSPPWARLSIRTWPDSACHAAAGEQGWPTRRQIGLAAAAAEAGERVSALRRATSDLYDSDKEGGSAPESRLKSGHRTAPCALYVGESNRNEGSTSGTLSESRYRNSANDVRARASGFCGGTRRSVRQ